MYKITALLDSEIYNTDYFQKNNVCRFCWCTGAERIISQSPGEELPDLVEKIKYCLGISLTPKSKPNKVCFNCLENIERFQNFKCFCLETDRRLLRLFENIPNEHTDLKPNIDGVKLEDVELNYSKLKCETIDEFSENACQLDLGSDDELPLQHLKKKKGSKTPEKSNKTKRKKDSVSYCYICLIDFVTKDKLALHNADSHGIEEGGFKCFGCEKKFKTRRGRVGHEVGFCKKLKEGYKCLSCEKYLPTRGSYEKHMKNHRENSSGTLPEIIVKCRKCCETFKTRETLKRHSKEFHGGNKKNYVCESCGKVFTRPDYLHKHKLTHTGTKLHVCPHCGFRTTQKSSLTVHIRKHTGERPYSCDLCPQKCISSSNLKAHRRRHLGIKKYECSICSKKFGYKLSLDEHFASTHDRSQAHLCSLCGASYSRVRGLKRHFLSKHAKDEKKLVTDDKNIGNDDKLLETMDTNYNNDNVFYVKLKENAYVKVKPNIDTNGVKTKSVDVVGNLDNKDVGEEHYIKGYQ